jgi:protein farnesyltransferase subunit beta
MLHRKHYETDNLSTETSREQTRTENSIMQYFYLYRQKQAEMFTSIKLSRDLHIMYCLKGLEHLSNSFDCLDASRPWLCYWIVHALDLLGHELSQDHKTRYVR